MSTDCVRSLSDKAEHTLTMHEHLYGNAEMDNQKHGSEEHQQDKLGQKKPRRKDTPVLNSPPLIPGKTSHPHALSIHLSLSLCLSSLRLSFAGVRLMKTEARMIHQEDEEKEMKK
ncbi:unnamed protein product [Leuciscus chuanchicus]